MHALTISVLPACTLRCGTVQLLRMTHFQETPKFFLLFYKQFSINFRSTLQIMVIQLNYKKWTLYFKSVWGYSNGIKTPTLVRLLTFGVFRCHNTSTLANYLAHLITQNQTCSLYWKPRAKVQSSQMDGCRSLVLYMLTVYVTADNQYSHLHAISFICLIILVKNKNDSKHANFYVHLENI